MGERKVFFFFFAFFVFFLSFFFFSFLKPVVALFKRWGVKIGNITSFFLAWASSCHLCQALWRGISMGEGAAEGVFLILFSLELGNFRFKRCEGIFCFYWAFAFHF